MWRYEMLIFGDHNLQVQGGIISIQYGGKLVFGHEHPSCQCGLFAWLTHNMIHSGSL
jgi:hypothetical protein